MFSRSLKTNIVIHLALLLLLAMTLIDFVVIIITQKALIRSETERGYNLLSGIDPNKTDLFPSNDVSLLPDYYSKLLINAGSSCIMVMNTHKFPVYSNGKNCELKNELEEVTRQTINTGLKASRFSGSEWGVFWLQNRDLIISVPLFRKGNIAGGTGIVMPLTGIYESLRRIQYILWIYIFINTIVFTLIGYYRLSRITIRPLQRLVKRAEEYQEDNEMFFLYEKEDNEFGKLSRALNRMLQHIAEDKEKLQAAVMSLEKANVDLKQTQQDMIRAEKLASVGRLSAGIAHEIGNPIGIIVGYLELLKQNDISVDDKKEYLLRTETEIHRIDGIIRQLLDISRPSSEDVRAVSVHTVIENTIDACQFHPLMSDIDLSFNPSAENDRVMADPNQLRQVFLNLLINAADAISSIDNPLKGKISIASKVVQSRQAEFMDDVNMLKIDYIDNGQGIAKENLGNIFDPFFTTKGPGKGTGLGLSVCFMIIESIGGKIEVTSLEGKGTTVTVCLPLISDKLV